MASKQIMGALAAVNLIGQPRTGEEARAWRERAIAEALTRAEASAAEAKAAAEALGKMLSGPDAAGVSVASVADAKARLGWIPPVPRSPRRHTWGSAPPAPGICTAVQDVHRGAGCAPRHRRLRIEDGPFDSPPPAVARAERGRLRGLAKAALR